LTHSKTWQSKKLLVSTHAVFFIRLRLSRILWYHSITFRWKLWHSFKYLSKYYKIACRLQGCGLASTQQFASFTAIKLHRRNNVRIIMLCIKLLSLLISKMLCIKLLSLLISAVAWCEHFFTCIYVFTKHAVVILNQQCIFYRKVRYKSILHLPNNRWVASYKIYIM